MDHDHDHGAGDGDGMAMSCPHMAMTFHAGYNECILWSGWMTVTVTEFVFSALAIFLVAFLYEVLKFLREYLLRKSAERMALEIRANKPSGSGGNCNRNIMSEMSKKSYKELVFSAPHMIQSAINLLQVIIAYLLMLVFMTYNYWLCLAVVLGIGIGYFFFGWIKQDAYDNECCN